LGDLSEVEAGFLSEEFLGSSGLEASWRPGFSDGCLGDAGLELSEGPGVDDEPLEPSITALVSMLSAGRGLSLPPPPAASLEEGGLGLLSDTAHLTEL
jgi:hypothetical protein